MQNNCQTPFFSLDVIDRHHPRRLEVESYVKQRYACAFDAELTVFMPTYLALMDGQDILSVCGYRVASEESLFLEHYLETPAEVALAQHAGQPISRGCLIEFGQMAAFSKGHSPVHMYFMLKHLISLQYEWCICTVTDPLLALMKRLNLTPMILRDADAQCVENAHEWGSYYQYSPRVVAGNMIRGLEYLTPFMIAQGIEAEPLKVSSNGLSSNVLTQYK